MKESSDKAMEVNNEPGFNVDEQQDDKTFKVKSDLDYSDDGQEITDARTQTCNQTLALKNWCQKTYRGRAH